MRTGHFERLAPVCPTCRQNHQQNHKLKIASVFKQGPEGIIEGVLHCTNLACQLEFPIIEGIPIIVPNTRKYISENLDHIVARTDFSAEVESILGDCVGPGTYFDLRRQHLSAYGWDHFGDASTVSSTGQPAAASGDSSIISVLDAALSLIDSKTRGPAIDLGCAVGRTTHELAEKSGELALGVDIHFAMLRLASEINRGEETSFPLRRSGVVYDQLIPEPGRFSNDRVDFWACDATALPFADQSFGLACGMNVLDSVNSPVDLLRAISQCLAHGGHAVIACPYDWTAAVTPMESWIGGHSQRGEGGGSVEHFLKILLTPGAHPFSIDGLEWMGEIERYPWQVRNHDRSSTTFDTHVFALRKQAG